MVVKDLCSDQRMYQHRVNLVDSHGTLAIDVGPTELRFYWPERGEYCTFDSTDELYFALQDNRMKYEGNNDVE